MFKHKKLTFELKCFDWISNIIRYTKLFFIVERFKNLSVIVGYKINKLLNYLLP